MRPVDGCADGVGELVYRGPTSCSATPRTGRPRARRDARRAAHRRPRSLRPGRWRVRDRRPALPVREAVRAADRPRRGRGDAGSCAGVAAVATGDDDRLVVCVPGGSPTTLRAPLVALTGLPAGDRQVDTGDGPATRPARSTTRRSRSARQRRAAGGEAAASVAGDVRRRARARGRHAGEHVRLARRRLAELRRVLGAARAAARALPPTGTWAASELEAIEHRRGTPRLDTTALLRAIGILLVVSTHMHLWWFPGGTHLLLAVVGYNTSRFHLSIDGTRDRVTAMARSVARLAVPSSCSWRSAWLLVGGYGLATLALVNSYLGPVDAPGRAMALLVRRGRRADPRAVTAPPRHRPVRRARAAASRTCSRLSCSPARSCCASSGWRSAATTTCASSPTASCGSSCSAGSCSARPPCRKSSSRPRCAC